MVNLRARARDRADAALTFLRKQIADGAWQPGEKLPTERELVTRFGIARNTLRKSLRGLEAEGRITRHVGRGTFVAEPGDAIRHDDALTHKIHRASPAEVMDLRLMLEPQAGELAAVRATGDDIAAMEECLRGCECAGDVAAFEAWDGRLHQRIVAAARNRLLADIYDVVNGVRRTAEWGKLKERSLTAERRATYQEQHRRIVAALRARDPDLTRDQIRDHLLAVRASLSPL